MSQPAVQPSAASPAAAAPDLAQKLHQTALEKYGQDALFADDYAKDRNLWTGHWMLPDGRITGDVRHHENSAQALLMANGINPRIHPDTGVPLRTHNAIGRFMAHSGALRLHANKTGLHAELRNQPTPQQAFKLLSLAHEFGEQRVPFRWEVRSPLVQRGTDEELPVNVASGDGVMPLSQFDWSKLQQAAGQQANASVRSPFRIAMRLWNWQVSR